MAWARGASELQPAPAARFRAKCARATVATTFVGSWGSCSCARSLCPWIRSSGDGGGAGRRGLRVPEDDDRDRRGPRRGGRRRRCRRARRRGFMSEMAEHPDRAEYGGAAPRRARFTARLVQGGAAARVRAVAAAVRVVRWNLARRETWRRRAAASTSRRWARCCSATRPRSPPLKRPTAPWEVDEEGARVSLLYETLRRGRRRGGPGFRSGVLPRSVAHARARPAGRPAFSPRAAHRRADVCLGIAEPLDLDDRGLIIII